MYKITWSLPLLCHTFCHLPIIEMIMKYHLLSISLNIVSMCSPDWFRVYTWYLPEVLRSLNPCEHFFWVVVVNCIALLWKYNRMPLFICFYHHVWLGSIYNNNQDYIQKCIANNCNYKCNNKNNFHTCMPVTTIHIIHSGMLHCYY